MKLDPKTLHGLHYSEEDFDAEIEKRLNAQIKKEGEDWDEDDRSSFKREFMRRIYEEWNPETDSDDFMKFEMANSLKYRGEVTSGYIDYDPSDPLLEPIHGISLEDYAIIVKNVTLFDLDVLLSAFGIDVAIWQEVNILWPDRMAEDSTFKLFTLYGEYFSTQSNSEIINRLKAEHGVLFETNQENLDRMRTDKYFRMELEAARTVAYEYGIDGAQWIEDNYGISLIDFQSVVGMCATERNLNFDSRQIMEDNAFEEQKVDEYRAKFAAEQGGNIADDIDF